MAHGIAPFLVVKIGPALPASLTAQRVNANAIEKKKNVVTGMAAARNPVSRVAGSYFNIDLNRI
ncbi:MAG: hypothetical protein HPY82_01515 [Gammaproteobacteria bacterium]|nr:hypothetical protein [Gammaproteobacteria bacterium]